MEDGMALLPRCFDGPAPKGKALLDELDALISPFATSATGHIPATMRQH
jgi:hypothetical protein